MNKNLLKSLALAAAAILGATAVWAVPPPVPQTNYLKDTSFVSFTNTDCLKSGCHGKATELETHNALITRHHALIWSNKLNITPSCYNVGPTLPATLATGCHLLVQSGAQRPDGTFDTAIADVRDCKSCHTSATPHHTTTWAAAQDCQHCHGNSIDNPGDGHLIRDTAMDTGKGGITPGPVGRTVADPNNPGQVMIVQGCEACHQASATNPGFPILSNEANHHNTTLGFGPVGQCAWCHAPTGSKNSFTIRACEACHGIKSLHSIQWDTPNPANLGKLVPGAETPGFGHVGDNWDCWGCHTGWGGTATSDMPVYATTPAVAGLSAHTVLVGQAANLTINGEGFTNDGSNGTVFNPVVTIIGTSETITLTPFSFTQSEIQVALPTTLPVGVYEVRVEKDGTKSNLSKLVVSPAPPAVGSAVASGTTLTIAGKGFGMKPPAETTGLMGVFVDGVPAKIVSWTETRIVAAANKAVPAGKPVIVKGLFGAGSGTTSVASKKSR